MSHSTSDPDVFMNGSGVCGLGFVRGMKHGRDCNKHFGDVVSVWCCVL